MNFNHASDASRIAQQAIADLKSSIHVVSNNVLDGGLNTQILAVA